MAQHAKPAPAKLTQSHGFISVANSSENHPSKNLWIGSVMPDVTDSELRALFESHGEVAGVKLYPSRNFAYVYFREIESARSAMQGLQGHVLRGNRLKIEFAKPQTFPQAKPCSSLLVALISRSVTKEDLQREFLKFGSIKKVSFLRDSNTAYIDFVRLEDATQALTCMNGKRIGGDQIRVDFWRGEQGPDANQVQFSSTITATSEYRWMAKDSSKNYPQPSLAGTKRQNQFLDTVPPKRDAVQMDFQGLNPPALRGCPPFLGLSGSGAYIRPSFLCPHTTFKPAPPGFDNNQLQRDSKRSKINTDLSLERAENKGGLGEKDALNLGSSGGATVSLTSVPTSGLGKLQSRSSSMWRGTIAKGGVPICLARCVPIGEGIDVHMPEVIDCSERIELALLSTHYEKAIGFSTICFLPDSESDFAAYMEFMSYLVCKDRAGIIRIDEHTPIFLVPPKFLSKVLKVSGPECLYGVLLKFSVVASTSTSMNPPSTQNREPCTKEKVLPEVSKVPPKTPSPVNSCGQQVQSASLPLISSKWAPPRNVFPGPSIDIAHWKHEHTLDHNRHIVQRFGNSEPSGSRNVAPEIKYEHGSSQGNLWGQVCGSYVPKPMPYMQLPRLESENRSQQLHTDPNGEIQNGTEIDDENRKRYFATLSLAAYILGQRNQLPDNHQPGQGTSGK
ncbi:hypothetical protein ACP275_14G306800 [Erythranthe tilingii]